MTGKPSKLDKLAAGDEGQAIKNEKTKKMTSAERRRQLLDVAIEIVRSEGTALLTLGRLSTAAAVSKPVVYDHFESRAALLKALYLDYDQKQREALHYNVKSAGENLLEVTRIVSKAFVECFCQHSEVQSVADALSASGEMGEFKRTLRMAYVDDFKVIFGSLSDNVREDEDFLFESILGTMETVSKFASSGRLSQDKAISLATDLVVGALINVGFQTNVFTDSVK